jgi:hypothetical protein
MRRSLPPGLSFALWIPGSYVSRHGLFPTPRPAVWVLLVIAAVIGTQVRLELPLALFRMWPLLFSRRLLELYLYHRRRVYPQRYRFVRDVFIGIPNVHFLLADGRRQMFRLVACDLSCHTYCGILCIGGK